MGRAWGRTSADLPDLQPVVIYEREVPSIKATVEAWILSLNPKFEYMRPSMYMHADAFIYTYEATELAANAKNMLEYLDPFIKEAHQACERVPPQALVGTWIDPTLQRAAGKPRVAGDWMQKHGIDVYFDLDMADKQNFSQSVEKIFNDILNRIETK